MRVLQMNSEHICDPARLNTYHVFHHTPPRIRDHALCLRCANVISGVLTKIRISELRCAAVADGEEAVPSHLPPCTYMYVI